MMLKLSRKLRPSPEPSPDPKAHLEDVKADLIMGEARGRAIAALTQQGDRLHIARRHMHMHMHLHLHLAWA